jgi:hypothetical protein
VHHASPKTETVDRHPSTESDEYDEPRERSMDEGAAEVRVDDFEPLPIGSESVRSVDVTQDLLEETNDDDNNERGGDRSEESASEIASKEESKHEVIDENKVQEMRQRDLAFNDGESNKFPIDDTNKAIDEVNDPEATEEELEITTEEVCETARLDETTTIEVSDEIEVSEERLDIALDNESSVVGDDIEALAQQSSVAMDVDEGTDLVVDQKIAGCNIEVDDSLDQDEYVAEQGESALVDSGDYSAVIDGNEAGDTSTGVGEQQLDEDPNDEPVFMSIDLRAAPEEDGVDSFSIGSIHVTIEPTEQETLDDEPEPTPLQRILRMAAAAGVVIDPSLAKDGGSSMANRPPLLTALCPGPPEMRMLLSHCRAQV